jgi:diguanylate cyclase (GGDEF)-like protein
MKILAADDDPISLRVLDAALKASGHGVVLARDGGEAMRLLESDSTPRLAILDWNMPGRDGVEICRWLRSRDGAPYIYTILLTSRSQTADRVAGLDSGADDFIIKPFHRDELQARVRCGVRLLTVQEQLETAQRLLRDQAAHDALTGLLNHGTILSHLERDVARSRRDGRPVAAVMADLDHFKQINDGLGHPAGDAVLREVARRMTSVLRASDAMGRYGGEEFLAVLSGTDGAGALRVAERLRQTISGEPIRVGTVELDVTCSFGVAVSRSGHTTVEALVAAADAALYRAKRAGRNRVELADDDAPRHGAVEANRGP